MIEELKVIIEDCLQQTSFEPNDRHTRAAFVESVSSALGLQHLVYPPVIVICDETNNTSDLIEQNKIMATVVVGEEPPVILDVIFGPTGVDFLD